MNTNNQTIPAGYKQTEVGVIPNDWEVEELKNIVDFKNGKAHENSIVENGKYIVVNSKFISTEGDVVKYSNECLCPAEKGSVLMVMSDVPNGRAIAKCYLVDENNKYTINQRICSLKPKIDSKFLYYKIDRNPYFLSFDDGVKQTNLRKDDIQVCKLGIPSDLKEQTSISTVLYDVNRLIQKTEKLISKKRAIKQGAMQELLTGKRRLTGFRGEWMTDHLPNICWFQEGPGVRTYQFTNSGTKLLNGTNINDNILDLSTTERYISDKQANGMYSHFLADENDIVIASSGITIDKFDEKVAIVDKASLPLCMNTSTIRLKAISPKISREYLFYFLQSDSFKKQIGGQATGSAQLNFGPYHLKRVEINLPHDEKEQNAITSILLSVDKEIRLLEKKLEKYQQIKQGAMQVLLTGKIRLIKN
ncbi:MAG TPA: restriction endonuclease subunit S [Candidatus Wunengus sp. YC60]|uniref:restriction endonuclease subunit S n=1 Tax=Candidatus Wunengus sp. YC60 TaxID=3367697 RepID=UPI0040287087